MTTLATPFLRLHGCTDEDVRRLLGKPDPTRHEVSLLELAVAAELLTRAGYTVKLRRES